MKKLINNFLLLLALGAFTLTSCGGDDDENTTGNSVSYTLNEIGNSEVDGSIEFKELTDGRIQAEIKLNGTKDGDSHPSHVHMNSAAVGGDIIISLEPVAGATGSSVTVFDNDDNGNAIAFTDISQLDAYVNIHKSASELDVIVAQGDIGSNKFTGEEYTYTLDEKDVEGISGEVTFVERENGFALATIKLNNTPDGGMHPAHIHMNSAAETGDILISFNPVDGTTGESVTEIRATDTGERFDYKDILTADAYINVHLSESELSTIVAQGDIGVNELTGEIEEYELGEKDVDGISGKITFSGRMNGSVLAVIELSGTPEGGSHPAHIHENSAAEGGPILVSFNPVNGSNGKSFTSISVDDDGNPFNFQSIENLDAYINVHLSMDDLDTIVAQGDIGINN